MSVAGVSNEWKDSHDAWCYTSTIVGQVGALAAMGWNFAIIVDLIFIVYFPTRYGAKETRQYRWTHLAVWSVALCSLLPALATGSVGLSPDRTCWMLGPYIWTFWGFWCAFVASALGAIAAIFWKLSRDGSDSDVYRAAQPFVKVMHGYNVM